MRNPRLALFVLLAAFSLFSVSAFAQTSFTNLASRALVRATSNAIPVIQVVGGTIVTNRDANGTTNIITVTGGGGSGSNFVQIGLGAAPTAATNAVRLTDLQSASNAAITAVTTASNALRAGNLVFLLTFDQTNGVGSNIVAAATPRVGRFLHATGVGGVPPNGLIPMITNRALTYQPISNVGTIYLGYSAVGPIQRVKMVFRMRETYGAGAAVSPYVHLVGNGEFVASSDLFAHGGFSPQVGVVQFDGHLGGFGGQPSAQPSVAVTNVDTVFWPLQEGLGRLNTFEYWRTGTNVAGHVNGWPFILPYTNALAFTNQTNLIVQFFANDGNALSGRNPEIVSIAAWDSPYPSVDNEALPDGMVNPVFYGATVYRNLTNSPGSRIIGAGSNSIERITTLQATNAAVVAQTNDSLRVLGPILLGQPGGPVIQTITGTNSMLVFGENRASLTNVESITGQGEQHAIDTGGVMFESGPTVNSQAEFILFANSTSNLLLRALAAQTSPQLQLGNVGLLAGSVTFTNLTVLTAFTNTGPSALLGGGTLTGVFSGAGNSVLTNLTALASTNGLHSPTAFQGFWFTGTSTDVSAPGAFIRVNSTGYLFPSTVPAVFASTLSAAGLIRGTNGLTIGRTNTYTAAEIPVGGGGIWVSNTAAGRPDAIFMSVNGNGSVTNWLVPVTK